MVYLTLKYLHITLAVATLAGFMLRGFWMIGGSPLLEARLVRIAPHIVDTIFLLTGVAMLMLTSTNPLRTPWLLAKLSALVGYVVLGSIALRRGSTQRIRMTAFVAALLCFAYIVGVALAKSPTGWFAR